MTWKLSRRSKNELDGVHPDLIEVVHRCLEISPVDFGVHDGIRNVHEQRELVKRKVSRTMNSRHLRGKDGYGHAVDLVPYINRKLRWEWAPIYELASAMRQASQELLIPLRWGGVWDRRLGNLDFDMKFEVEAYVARRKQRYPGRDVFIDGPHFELPRIKAYL